MSPFPICYGIDNQQKKENLMPALTTMPPLSFPQSELKIWGDTWLGTAASSGGAKKPNRFDKKQGMDFGQIFDNAFGAAIAAMLGGVPIERPHSANSLLPPKPDCVEIGTTRVVGGIRPQNYDAAYRPDGARIVFDSKTLNDAESIGKNWQNMVNDLSTEASTAHTRFPYCIVAFIVALPKPALSDSVGSNIIRTLERMGTRSDVLDQAHLAEALALIVWDPSTGLVDPNLPALNSVIRIENMPTRIETAYVDRYKGLPPHD